MRVLALRDFRRNRETAHEDIGSVTLSAAEEDFLLNIAKFSQMLSDLNANSDIDI
jgi:hypothetical protein